MGLPGSASVCSDLESLLPPGCSDVFLPFAAKSALAGVDASQQAQSALVAATLARVACLASGVLSQRAASDPSFLLPAGEATLSRALFAWAVMCAEHESGFNYMARSKSSYDDAGLLQIITMTRTTMTNQWPKTLAALGGQSFGKGAAIPGARGYSGLGATVVVAILSRVSNAVEMVNGELTVASRYKGGKRKGKKIGPKTRAAWQRRIQYQRVALAAVPGGILRETFIAVALLAAGWAAGLGMWRKKNGVLDTSTDAWDRTLASGHDAHWRGATDAVAAYSWMVDAPNPDVSEAISKLSGKARFPGAALLG